MMLFRKGVLFVVCGLACASCFAEAYSFQWWMDGWRGRSAGNTKLLAFQTDRYAAAFDVEKPALPHLGLLAAALPYADAASCDNSIVTALPAAALALTVAVDGRRYSCAGAAGKQDDEANFPVRLIDSGRFVQRADILHVLFKDENGKALDGEGRLEIVAWPERLYLILEVTPEAAWRKAEMTISLEQNGKLAAYSVAYSEASSSERPLNMGIFWPPEDDGAMHDPAWVHATESSGDALPVTWDMLRGEYIVDLPERNWNIAAEPDRLDRFPLRLENPDDVPRTFNILFTFDQPFAGVTGLCPMLRDATGNPTGIPVQISKNWHQRAERHFLYEGPWFHGYTQIAVPAHGAWSGEFDLTYARWGGVPSASHAQLCLIGWGTNQRWDQAAIGSWGESICYDPDVNLNRSMIDDMRPLMVTGMSGGQYEWTCNVGGADFLVYCGADGNRQYLSRVRAAYLCQGPNLTDLVYSGITPDGAIEARIEVMSPRCDDVNRSFHRIRYDVRKPVSFSRLAFYQLGADHYNDHTFTSLARGHAGGLVEEWPVGDCGGKKYLRRGIACEGDAPWFSLHGGERNVHHKKGAWANRGLVVRSWKARIDGQVLPCPTAAIYGTQNGVPSANVELTPPPDVTALEAGDFVEMEVECLVVPVSAEDYFGPNASLRADLEANGNTWRVIQRLAQGNNFEVRMEQGALERRYPIAVRADANERAVFEVRGGLGYAPVSVCGLHTASGYALKVQGTLVDQSVQGNDFWQMEYDAATATYRQTYNVCLDRPDTDAAPWRFEFGPKE